LKNVLLVFNVKKFALRIILLFSLFSILIPLSKVNIVNAESTIYIRSDGSVEGTDKIQRDGNVYSFIGDINGSIIVEKDNIVVDGAGYTLQGIGSGVGLNLTARSNVTIKNIEIKAFHEGISLASSSECNISGNNITENTYYGIWLFMSSDNVIFGNNITNNYYGIKLWLSSNNAFCENNITHNGCGIWFASIKNSSVSRNNVKNSFRGIHLEASSANIISANNIIGNSYGIQLERSPNNNVSINNIIGNSYGIHLKDSPNNNVSINNITSNQYGIVLSGPYAYSSGENIVYGNNITNNDFGIQVISPSNSIYYNNFINNTKQAYTEEYSFFGANYWSDYTGKDRNGDNIGDTPYGDYLDLIPLMRPWTLGWRPKPSVDQALEEEIPFWMQWWFWTIIAVVIVTLAGTVYLKKRKPSISNISPPPTEDYSKHQSARQDCCFFQILLVLNPNFDR
jgi:parallel beta-helix repeat protein